MQLPIATCGESIVVCNHQQRFVSIARKVQKKIDNRITGLGTAPKLSSPVFLVGLPPIIAGSDTFSNAVSSGNKKYP